MGARDELFFGVEAENSDNARFRVRPSLSVARPGGRLWRSAPKARAAHPIGGGRFKRGLCETANVRTRHTSLRLVGDPRLPERVWAAPEPAAALQHRADDGHRRRRRTGRRPHAPFLAAAGKLLMGHSTVWQAVFGARLAGRRIMPPKSPARRSRRPAGSLAGAGPLPLLGEALLAVGRPAEALSEFEQFRMPNFPWRVQRCARR